MRPCRLLTFGYLAEVALAMAFALAVLVALLTSTDPTPLHMTDQPASPEVMQTWEAPPTTMEATTP